MASGEKIYKSSPRPIRCTSYNVVLCNAIGYIFCLNNIVDPNLACGTQSPIAFSTGNLNDISPMLQFTFWEPVYYLSDPTDRQFPGISDEKRGHYVGISENIGHSMTFIIITDDTNTKIERSVVRSALQKETANLREEPLSDEAVITSILKQKPHPDVVDQGVPSHRYPTRSRNTPDTDENSTVPLPGRGKGHRYELRSMNANLENQSFHFGIPSVTVQDLGPLHEFAINDDVPIHLQKDTHVFLKNYGECGNQKTEDGEPSINQTDDSIDTLEDYEVILKDEHGEPRVDEEGNPIKVICRPPSDLLGRVFLTKPDQRGNRQRARIVDVIKDFEDEVDINKN